MLVGAMFILGGIIAMIWPERVRKRFRDFHFTRSVKTAYDSAYANLTFRVLGLLLIAVGVCSIGAFR